MVVVVIIEATLGWALSYTFVTRTKSLPKAILGVFLLFGGMLRAFFLGLQIVERYGSKELN